MFARNWFAILAIALLSDVNAIQCPNGWVHHDTSCYLFVKLKETWADAEVHCKILGGILAEIGTARENNFLKSTLSALNTNKDMLEYWTGGTDLAVEGEWTWVVSKQMFPFTDWYPNEPNGNKIEQCSEMSPSYNYQWNDRRCDDTRYFICEIDENVDAGILG